MTCLVHLLLENTLVLTCSGLKPSSSSGAIFRKYVWKSRIQQFFTTHKGPACCRQYPTIQNSRWFTSQNLYSKNCIFTLLSPPDNRYRPFSRITLNNIDAHRTNTPFFNVSQIQDLLTQLLFLLSRHLVIQVLLLIFGFPIIGSRKNTRFIHLPYPTKELIRIGLGVKRMPPIFF